MKCYINSLAIAVTLAVAAPAFAEIVPCPEGGDCEVYKPDGWTSEAAKEGSQAILIAADPDAKAALLYVVVEAKNVDGAVKIIDAIVGKLVTAVTVKKGKAVKVGGMKGLAFSGTGTAADDGQPVTLNLIAVQPNDGHVLFAVAMVQTDVKAKYAGEFKKALAGIRKTK